MFVNHRLEFLFLVTCPANADCFPNGPGSTECLCQAGWFGYKCLVKVRLLIFLCVLWFNNIPMDTPDFERRRWKIKTQNNPMLNFQALKISSKQNKFGCTLLAKPCGRDTRALLWIFRLFEIPQKSLLKSSHSESYLPNFSTQKIRELEI